MGDRALRLDGAPPAPSTLTGLATPSGEHAAAGGWTFRTAYTLGFLTLIYAFNTADRNIFGLLMPLMKSEMHVSDTMLGFLSGFAFACFYALAGIPIAYLSERWSRRNIIAIGFVVWSVMTVATGFVQNIVQLTLARFMLGAGEAGGIAPSNSMIGDLFDRRRRTVALSILQCANSLGILVAFPLIGWIAAQHGWRSAYIAAGLPGLALGVLFVLTVREPRRGQTDDLAQGQAPPSPQAFLPLVRKLIASRPYLLAATATTLLAINLSGMQTWTPTFLMRVHHLEPQLVGSYIGAIRGPTGIAGAVFGGLVTSWMARRDNRWLVWTPAIFIFLIGLADLVLLWSDGGGGWKLGMAIETFCTSAQVGPMFGLLLAAADSRSRAMATAATMLVVYLVGLTVGPLAVGALNDLLQPYLGGGGIRYSMLAVASTAAMAGLVLLSIGRLDGDQRSLPPARN